MGLRPKATLSCCLSLPLVACSVPVVIKTASVSPDHRISVEISKRDWNKVISHQIYVYIRVVDCQTGDFIESVYPRMNGISSGDFRAMQAELDRSPGDAITLQGSVERVSDPRRPSCATLVGGSYLGGQVQTGAIPIAFAGQSH